MKDMGNNMSSTLTVEPANRKKKNLSFELKLILQKRYNGCIHHKFMDLSDVGYVKGLVDAEIKGSAELLEYLEKYEEINLNEEF